MMSFTLGINYYVFHFKNEYQQIIHQLLFIDLNNKIGVMT